jgi:hypothetical protein
MASFNTSGYTPGAAKKTSIGRNKSRIKKSSMNKHKKRSYKAYAGQGKEGRPTRRDKDLETTIG